MIEELKTKLPHDLECASLYRSCEELAEHGTRIESRCNCTRREILERVEATEASNKQWGETMADLVKSIKDNAPPVLFQALLLGVDRYDR